MSLFITGTGTGVGKTVITAGLADALRRRGESVCVYKPIQTGSLPHEPEDPTHIRQWLGEGIVTACTYCFTDPVAPYTADPERTIQAAHLFGEFRRLQKSHSRLLVEGAGGVRVPIAPRFEMLDLMKLFRLPVLVVASPFLGTVNHTLMTVDTLLHADLEVKGIVISGMPQFDSPLAQDPAILGLPEILHDFLPVPVFGFLPEFSLSKQGFQDISAQAHFDGLLEAISLPVLSENFANKK